MSGGWRTVASVADEFEVSPRTVLRWMERGDLAAVRLPGGRLRVEQAELARRVAVWSTTAERRLAEVGDEEERRADG